MSCWEQLGAVLAWEVQDSALQAEHFLTVSSYNLQHPGQFTEEALIGLRVLFIDHLDNDTPVKLLRRRAARSRAMSKEKVLKDEAERQIVRRHWPMTIADVYLPEHPEGAAERVRQWANSIRSEL
jgi:hypothetical protein